MFPANQMPLGGAVWTLVALALTGLLAITGTAGWLLFFYIAQHVRFV